MRTLPAAIVIVIIILFGAWWYFSSNMPAGTTDTPTSTVTILQGVPDATYTNTVIGFSVQYPSTATPSATSFEGYLPLTQTAIASLVLPSALSQATNLSEAGIYIGATSSPPALSHCTAVATSTGEIALPAETIGGQQFTVSAASDAGAGNFYDSKIYRTIQGNACLEFVELLHSTNIGNYPEGTVTVFDANTFKQILEAIVHSYRPLTAGQ